MSRTNAHAKILTYWRAIELFSSQRVPKPDPNHKKQPVFRVKASDPLPWQATHALQHRKLRPNLVWRHIVYGGLFTSDIPRDLLEHRFGDNPHIFDRPDSTTHCLFAFAVSDKGQPLIDTFALSSLGWALGRTLSVGPDNPDWLTGFVDTEDAARLDFEHRHALRIPQNPSDEGYEPNVHDVETLETEPTENDKTDNDTFEAPLSHLTHEDLIAEVQGCIALLGVSDLIAKPMARIRSIAINKKQNEDKNEPVLINSFFVDDLDRVASHTTTISDASALANYLTAPENLDIASRIDVRMLPNVVFETLSPASFPTARWPERSGHPLVTSQQFSINSIIHSLHDSTGVAAINGPPGTGKTTLLRDLIANVVVDRAKQLAKLISCDDAFESSTSWNAGDYPRTIWHWIKPLQGHEIVIASSNNGAVQNVTLEIPALDAIDPSAIGEDDHFQKLASHLLGEEAWGLMAAKLGKRANCSDFRSGFWFDRDADDQEQPKLPGMMSILNDLSGEPVDWEKAVNTFMEALNDSERLSEERQRLYERSVRKRNLIEETNALQALCNDLNKIFLSAKFAAREAEDDKTRAAAALEASKLHRLDHRRFRPGLLEIIFTFGRAFREWRTKDVELKSMLDIDEHLFGLATSKLLTRAQELSDEQSSYETNQIHLSSLNYELDNITTELKHAGESLDIEIPDSESDLWLDDTRRELSAPWADKRWNEARAQVFVAALALHRSFLQANSIKMKQSLHAAMDLLDGSVPADAPEETVANAWRAFFFVVPVVSTTFASFARLFSQLQAESLGWLLIDEAGQAPPQQAVGALWRARRAVIVGDPLQLEPIVSISNKAQEALQQHHGVDDTWAPGRTSVQCLADRTAHFGTFIDNGEEQVWVGSPLRVHRRCAPPMMGISNAIAYSGLMVDGTIPMPSTPWPKSQWIDIRGTGSEGQWVEAEGEATVKLLEALMSHGADAARIFVISPFRAVVDELQFLKKMFPGIQAGTVHTTQGKEADIVVLVLGSNPASGGARQWASSKPNLLNVAVSRAKRRLYVIGNLHLWQRCNYFSTCVTQLAQHSESESPEILEVGRVT